MEHSMKMDDKKICNLPEYQIRESSKSIQL